MLGAVCAVPMAGATCVPQRTPRLGGAPCPQPGVLIPFPKLEAFYFVHATGQLLKEKSFYPEYSTLLI